MAAAAVLSSSLRQAPLLPATCGMESHAAAHETHVYTPSHLLPPLLGRAVLLVAAAHDRTHGDEGAQRWRMGSR